MPFNAKFVIPGSTPDDPYNLLSSVNVHTMDNKTGNVGNAKDAKTPGPAKTDNELWQLGVAAALVVVGFWFVGRH